MRCSASLAFWRWWGYNCAHELADETGEGCWAGACCGTVEVSWCVAGTAEGEQGQADGGAAEEEIDGRDSADADCGVD